MARLRGLSIVVLTAIAVAACGTNWPRNPVGTVSSVQPTTGSLYTQPSLELPQNNAVSAETLVVGGAIAIFGLPENALGVAGPLTTPANAADVTQAHDLLHGEERIAFADAGYQGVEKRKENQGSSVEWVVAMGPGKRRALPDSVHGRLVEQFEHVKARIRAKVEHPFHVIKNILGLRKVRCHGLAKNTAQLFTVFGLANLVMAKRRLFALHTQGAS